MKLYQLYHTSIYKSDTTPLKVRIMKDLRQNEVIQGVIQPLFLNSMKDLRQIDDMVLLVSQKNMRVVIQYDY
jgi:hypothetical protein